MKKAESGLLLKHTQQITFTFQKYWNQGYFEL